MTEIAIDLVPIPPEWHGTHAKHYCTDPGATLKLDGDLLVISQQEGASAQHVEVRWGPDGTHLSIL
jgi:hypothetical protein